MGLFNLVLVSAKGKDVEIAGSIVEYLVKYFNIDKILKSLLGILHLLQDLISSYQLSVVVKALFEAWNEFLEALNFLIHNGKFYYR